MAVPLPNFDSLLANYNLGKQVSSHTVIIYLKKLNLKTLRINTSAVLLTKLHSLTCTLNVL